MAIIDFKATKCRHCYKCVRNCEVKAIMVKDGRAEIMPENCILCGRCLQICPQSAKTLVSDLERVRGFLEDCGQICRQVPHKIHRSSMISALPSRIMIAFTSQLRIHL